MPPLAVVVLGLYAVMSIAAFALYAWDKRCATRGWSRVRERTLHLVALLGGFPGALVAQQVVRHKRCKPLFVLLTWSFAAIHGAAWALALGWIPLPGRAG